MTKKIFIIMIAAFIFLTGCAEWMKEPVLDDITNNLAATPQTIAVTPGLVETASDPPYIITTEAFSQDRINIQYPQIHGLGDNDREKAVNDLIKYDFIETQINPVPVDDGEILILDLNYRITMQTSEILSVLYTGRSTYYSGYPEVESHGFDAEEIYAITINLNTVTKLKLSDFTAIDDDLVKKIKQSTEFTNTVVEEGWMDKSELYKMIQDRPDESILRGLTLGDEYNDSDMFCVTPDSLYISILINNASGNYALVEIPYRHTKYK